MKRTAISLIICAALLFGAAPVFTAPAQAGDAVVLSPSLTADEFSDLAVDLSRGAWFNPMTPAKPLGFPGFYGAVELNLIPHESSDHWRNATPDHQTPNLVLTSRLHLMAGLPGDTDIGLMTGSVNDAGADIFGLEIRHALMDGSIAGPELGLRAAFASITGLGEADVSTFSTGIHISKKLVIFHPYAGVEYLLGRVRESSDAVSFDDETTSQLALMAGFHLTVLPFARVSVEASEIGGQTRIGAGFAVTF